MPAYCDVAVPAPLDGPFTYVVPERMRAAAVPGVRVIVSFAGRMVTGIVTGLPEQPQSLTGLKEIVRVVDVSPVLDEDLLKLGRWIADYYHAPEGEVFRTMLPLGVEVSTRRVVRLTEAGLNFVSPVSDLLRKAALPEKSLRRRCGLAESDLRKLERAGIIERVSESRERLERHEYEVTLGQGWEDVPLKREQRVVQLLISDPRPWPASELAERVKVPASLLRDMAARGLLDMRKTAPLKPKPALVARVVLNPGQDAALAAIRAALGEQRFAVFLLEGVTGSGKTEVYLRAMDEVLAKGGGALMLVPEIALTPAMAEQFVSRFGESVAILHSGFAGRERSREWRRVRNGEARVVVGTRSAVFAPLARLDLVIVDEEQDSSYKQEETPRYNGRDVAVLRARNAEAVVVLGSATPSLESRYNTERGKYRLLELAGRVEDRPMAQVTVVDMRQEFLERRKQAVFSRLLMAGIKENLAAGEQVMVLLNRRGYSAFVLCRSCGVALQCENCSIALTHHRSRNLLLCHYCDFNIPVPQVCPKCSSEHIYFMGQGTERIENLLAEEFPAARIARLDRDTAGGKQKFESILKDFRGGQYDILVGTQMIAKGHDIHNVTLAGVVSADIALGLPDFRAAERTFQLLTQVAGRAGRGVLPGRVILQTYFPDHYAIQSAAAQDYQAFYQKELRFRRVMHYPPFTSLAAILVRSAHLEEAMKLSGQLSKRISQGEWKGVRVLGPAAAPLLKLKQEFRYQFLIKSQRHDTLNRLLKDLRACAKEQKFPPTALVVDVDPVSLM